MKVGRKMNIIEEAAVKLLKSGIDRDTVESKLGYEFMVYNDLITGKIHHASIWKKINNKDNK